MEQIPYEKLTIRENFMFTKVMSDPKLLKGLLVRILPHLNINEIDIVIREKSIDEFPYSHGIRFDVYARDGKRMFGVEMQVVKNRYLPKRGRYYQGTADMEDLNKGVSYSELKDQYIIFICPFDPFDDNILVYTFTNRCHETGKELGDETTKIFINCSGRNSEDYPQLKPFADYVMGEMSEDAYVAELDHEVRKARGNPLWRKEYMDFQERLQMAREEGRQEGKEEGRAEGREEGRAEERYRIARELAPGFLKEGKSAEDVCMIFRITPEELAEIMETKN